MKRLAMIAGLILVGLTPITTALGQNGCELNIVGTWKAEKSDQANPILYRFTPDARVRVLSRSGQSSELREIASAGYTLDNPKAPKTILVKAEKGVSGFAKGITSLVITGYDDTSMTLVKSSAEPVRWVRVDPYKYYIVLAGRIGTFYDRSGPTFPMLIKTDGKQTQIDAVGTYADGSYWAFGAVPPETYNEFMKESGKDSDVMLRLEITAAQYERGLKIVKTWERRASNDELLYFDVLLDNILMVKQVAESLNQCGESFKLYKLDWSLEDNISSSSPRDDNPFSRIPFLYFKELKRLNQSLHVTDAEFYGHEKMLKQTGQ